MVAFKRAISSMGERFGPQPHLRVSLKGPGGLMHL